MVVNQEEQYSIWLADRPLPSGWIEVDLTGTKDECLAHIAGLWTDITPRTVRQSRAI